MRYPISIIEVIEDVLAWGLTDEAFPEAVSAYAGLLARINPEEIGEFCLD